jgi:hypothetical protein
MGPQKLKSARAGDMGDKMANRSSGSLARLLDFVTLARSIVAHFGSVPFVLLETATTGTRTKLTDD